MSRLYIAFFVCAATLIAAAPNPVAPLHCAPTRYGFDDLAPGDAVTKAPDGAWTLNTSRLSSSGMPFNGDASAVFDSSKPPVHEEDLGTPGECASGPGVGSGGRKGKPGQNCIPLGNLLIAHDGNTTALRNCKCEGYACGACQPNDAMHGAVFLFLFRDSVFFRHVIAVDLEGDEALVVAIPGHATRRVQGLGSNSVQKVGISHHFVPGQTLALRCTGSCAFAELVMDVCTPIKHMIVIPHKYDPRPMKDDDKGEEAEKEEKEEKVVGEPHVMIEMADVVEPQVAIKTPDDSESDVTMEMLDEEEPHVIINMYEDREPDVAVDMPDEEEFDLPIKVPEIVGADVTILMPNEASTGFAVRGTTPAPNDYAISETLSPSGTSEVTTVENLSTKEPVSTIESKGHIFVVPTPVVSEMPNKEPTISGMVGLRSSDEPSTISQELAVPVLGPSPEPVNPTVVFTPEDAEITPASTVIETEEPMTSEVLHSAAPLLVEYTLAVTISPEASMLSETTASFAYVVMTVEATVSPEMSMLSEMIIPSVSILGTVEATITPQTSMISEMITPFPSVVETELGVTPEASMFPETMASLPSVVESLEVTVSTEATMLSAMTTSPTRIMETVETTVTPEASLLSEMFSPLASIIETVETTVTPETSTLSEMISSVSSIGETEEATVTPEISMYPELSTSFPSVVATAEPAVSPEASMASEIITPLPSIMEIVEMIVTTEASMLSETITPLASIMETVETTITPEVSKFSEVITLFPSVVETVEVAVTPEASMLSGMITPFASALNTVEAIFSPEASVFSEIETPLASVMEIVEPANTPDVSIYSEMITPFPSTVETVEVMVSPEATMSSEMMTPLTSTMETFQATATPDMSMLSVMTAPFPSVGETAEASVTPEVTISTEKITPLASVRETVEATNSFGISDLNGTTQNESFSAEQSQNVLDDSFLTLDPTPVTFRSPEKFELAVEPSVAVSPESDELPATPEPSMMFVQSVGMVESNINESVSTTDMVSWSSSPDSIDSDTAAMSGIATITAEMTYEVGGTMISLEKTLIPPSVEQGAIDPSVEGMHTSSLEEVETTPMVSETPWASKSAAPSVAMIEATLPITTPIAEEPTDIFPCNVIDAPINFAEFPLGSPIRGGKGFMLRTYRLGPSWRNDTSAIFDTGNPGANDLDLGAPNENCIGSGPGVGDGGKPETIGSNCEPLGMALISHSGDVEVLRRVCKTCPMCKECAPDDNPHGAHFIFEFTQWTSLRRLVMLDVDEQPSALTVTDSSNTSYEYAGYGDNSKLVVDLRNMQVSPRGTLQIKCAGSCAVIEIDRAICAPKFKATSVLTIDTSLSNDSEFDVESSSAPIPTSRPHEKTHSSVEETSKLITPSMNPLTAFPQHTNYGNDAEKTISGVNETKDEIDTSGNLVPKPTRSGTFISDQIITAPLKMPSLPSMCQARNITFQEFHTGMPITEGDDWKLKTCRIEWNKSRTCGVSAAFNTSSPSASDLDLGAPHRMCPGGGIGVGYGGKPNQLGRNCRKLGMVLIAAGGDVEELRKKCANGMACEPNDNAGGGEFSFSFDFKVRIIAVTLMDLDDEERSASIITKNTITYVRGLGDNSVQTVYMSDAQVGVGTEAVIHCTSSCAIISVVYSPCM